MFCVGHNSSKISGIFQGLRSGKKSFSLLYYPPSIIGITWVILSTIPFSDSILPFLSCLCPEDIEKKSVTSVSRETFFENWKLQHNQIREGALDCVVITHLGWPEGTAPATHSVRSALWSRWNNSYVISQLPLQSLIVDLWTPLQSWRLSEDPRVKNSPPVLGRGLWQQVARWKGTIQKIKKKNSEWAVINLINTLGILFYLSAKGEMTYWRIKLYFVPNSSLLPFDDRHEAYTITDILPAWVFPLKIPMLYLPDDVDADSS